MTQIRSILFCVAIISSQLLITGITAGTVTSSDHRSLIIPDSGRSLVLWSLLLLPLGIGLLVLAAIVLIPIPLISTGGAAGRAIYDKNNRSRAINLAKRVMASEECVERISCEIKTITKDYEATSWIPRKIESYLKNSHLGDKVSRGLHATNPCKQFNCNPIQSLKKLE